MRIRLSQRRDELSFRNIRGGLWPLLLVFPLTVIMGDLRYLDLEMEIAGFQSYELLSFALGLGWLVLCLLPRRLTVAALCLSAVLSAFLLPFQIFLPTGIPRLGTLLAFQFLNGICAASAFHTFCFELRNVERLFAMIIIQFYYGLLYTVWRAFPAFGNFCTTWGSAAVMAACLVVVFACQATRASGQGQQMEGTDETAEPPPASDWSGSVALIFLLNIMYSIIMNMINYIEYAENTVSSMAFGLGAFASIILIIIIHLLNNRSALYSWLLFLALSLFGYGVLMFDSPVTRVSGSFAYGLGDGLGYVIIFYLCAGVIKKSRSFKIFRLFCLVSFAEFALLSAVFSLAFNRLEMPNHYFAFAVVLVLCSACFLLMPLMQKKLFEADWTDGIPLHDMAEYAGPLAQTEAINIKDHLGLTERECEIFTLLLTEASPKEIAYTLKVSYNTVVFHRQNLYRKLGIQSRAELFAKYAITNEKRGNLPV